MAFYQNLRNFSSRFRSVLSLFMTADGRALANVLPEEKIQQAFDEEGNTFGEDEDAIYTPPVTLMGGMSSWWTAQL